MESRIRVLFLIASIAAAGLSGCAATRNLFGHEKQEPAPPPAADPAQAIYPEGEPRGTPAPQIDSEGS